MKIRKRHRREKSEETIIQHGWCFKCCLQLKWFFLRCLVWSYTKETAPNENLGDRPVVTLVGWFVVILWMGSRLLPFDFLYWCDPKPLCALVGAWWWSYFTHHHNFFRNNSFPVFFTTITMAMAGASDSLNLAVSTHKFRR